MTDPTWVAVGRSGERVELVELHRDGARSESRVLTRASLTDAVADYERRGVRWVWSDTRAWYPELIAAGMRVARAHDLRLVHAILRDAAAVRDAAELRAAVAWDAPPMDAAPVAGPALFDLDEPASRFVPLAIDEVLAEFGRQRAALDAAPDGGRLRLLAVAESAGALIAVEMESAGLPWDRGEHERLLRAELGEPSASGRPRGIDALAARVRVALGDPTASLDSQSKLLRSLHRIGVLVDSTSKWELRRHEHPVVAPLLEYKRLMRLYTANGPAWLDEWVHDGRFRPVYIPAGVVTGRWASAGGGALQIPRNLRSAVRADPGWCFVIADVAQLEPRVLAAMSGDRALADAAHGRDLYAGVVARGAVQTRDEAKIAMLGAMYGATSGDSGRLMPSLRRAFPRAMGLVDDAAQVGERGGAVTTWLGRTSPIPGAAWERLQARASDVSASESDASAARRSARDFGRFTRNFVVQGTAAEWALAWLADLRTRLAAMDPVPAEDAAPRSGIAFQRQPHLAFFLHDEIIVHAPRAHADRVSVAVREAAASAGRLLFGDTPVDFLLDLKVTETAEKS